MITIIKLEISIKSKIMLGKLMIALIKVKMNKIQLNLSIVYNFKKKLKKNLIDALIEEINILENVKSAHFKFV